VEGACASIIAIANRMIPSAASSTAASASAAAIRMTIKP
jgi:hypothetical protein